MNIKKSIKAFTKFFCVFYMTQTFLIIIASIALTIYEENPLYILGLSLVPINMLIAVYLGKAVFYYDK